MNFSVNLREQKPLKYITGRKVKSHEMEEETTETDGSQKHELIPGTKVEGKYIAESLQNQIKWRAKKWKMSPLANERTAVK